LVICNLRSQSISIGFNCKLQITNDKFMPDAAANLDRFLLAIADPTRRRILRALKEKGGCSLDKETGLCAFDIEQRVKLAQPTVSHHMQILEKASLVEAKREGHWRWYRRNDKLIAKMMRGLKGQL
jgi:ArsR family transcriptional regulator, arsenate/arsenite/antimonite-responsive transcriptional repressor